MPRPIGDREWKSVDLRERRYLGSESKGGYTMPIRLYSTPHVTRVRRGLSALLVCVLWPLVATLAHADAVTDWNQTAIRAAASAGGSTGVQSRIVAIAHAAMFDAVNSIARQYTEIQRPQPPAPRTRRRNGARRGFQPGSGSGSACFTAAIAEHVEVP
jgi:hypothetical protein